MKPQAAQVKGFAGFMCSIGNRYSSRAHAFMASYSDCASAEDLWVMPAAKASTWKADRLRNCALWYLIERNRQLRTVKT